MSPGFRRCWFVAAGCVAFLGALSQALGVVADQPEASGDANPYAVIVDKNVFHLNPPPPPPEAPEAKPADLPQYKLTGIVKIGDQTRVLFALTPKDAKEPPTYLNLAAGEREGQLTLVSIDRDKEEVAVINSGTAMTLSVRSNSYAASGGTAPAAPSGVNPGGRRLPGFPGMPSAPGAVPAPAPAEAASTGGGGVVIIGGGDSGSDNGGSNPSPAPNPGGNYASQGNGNNGNYGGGNFGGGNYGGGNYGGGSGVSVSGSAPLNYGGGATIATPNGGSINLGANMPQGQTQNWPPTEPTSVEQQLPELLAASEGLDISGKNGSGAGAASGTGAAPGKAGPPMPPVNIKQ